MGNKRDMEAKVDVLWVAMKRHERRLSQLQERIEELEQDMVMTEREVMDFSEDVKMPEKVPAGMNFLEACKAMEEGKKVRNSLYGYFMMDPKYGTIMYMTYQGKMDPAFITVYAAMATDWEVYEDGV